MGVMGTVVFCLSDANGDLQHVKSEENMKQAEKKFSYLLIFSNKAKLMRTLTLTMDERLPNPAGNDVNTITTVWGNIIKAQYRLVMYDTSV